MIENAQMRRRSLLIGAGLTAAALAIPRAAIGQSTLSDIKSQLELDEVKQYMAAISANKIAMGTTPQDPMHYRRLMFILIVYRFSSLMILLLQAETVALGTTSTEAVSEALYVLDLIRTENLPPFFSEPILSLPLQANIVPRILCIAGLQLSKDVYPERKCPVLLD